LDTGQARVNDYHHPDRMLADPEPDPEGMSDDPGDGNGSDPSNETVEPDAGPDSDAA